MFKDILGDYATHWMTIFGVVLIAVIVFSPTGIAGAIVGWMSGQPSVGNKPAQGH
jgi:branched-chain amino acid transport system permease protein